MLSPTSHRSVTEALCSLFPYPYAVCKPTWILLDERLHLNAALLQHSGTPLNWSFKASLSGACFL